jgi:2-methylcitrate dehydratase PrpD
LSRDGAAGSLLGEIAAYGARDATGELPAEVLHHAKRAVIDWFAALYPGTRVSPTVNLVQAHAAELGVGRSSLPGFGTTAFPATAAWINGSASHSVEFDDIFRDAVYHPGCPVVAAALALAEDRGMPGRNLLAAITVGYEISTRIGGVFGGAAAAAALVAPGHVGVMRHALATAGTFASGLQQAFRSDAMTRPLHAGHAASVGVTSAMAAASGVTGASDILEGEASFGAVDGLGERYNITRITQKNHGGCGHAFAAIDATLELRARGVRAEDATMIAVASYKAALDVAGIHEPRTAAEAKFSIPYLVAYALVHGSVRMHAFDDSRIDDPQVRELMRKVYLREDPALTADFPNKRAAHVAITTTDGTRIEHFAPHRKGDPEAPLTDAEINDKFAELVAPVIGVEKMRLLRGKLWVLETLPIEALELV